jgi:osmotically-inducible protein OsmY
LIAPNINADSVDVKVSNGVVTLSGRTDNILTKKRAGKIAETVTGVKSVINNIMVLKSTRSDAKIEDDLVTALANNPATDAFQVNPEVNNGNVILSGTVGSWQEKELCREVAESVRGVRDVTNNININYNALRTDKDIKADVLSRLKWDIYVNQQFIRVSVNKGIVSLRGTVASAAEKEWAYDDAWVNGVNSVNVDDLRVQWWQNSSPEYEQETITLRDKEIKAALEQAFIIDPRVISDRINIKVNDGVVTLRGMVTDLQSKHAAERDARRTIGVFGIKNDLVVQPKSIPENVEIRDMVTRALKRNPYIDKSNIEVSVENGMVYLTGNVDNKFEKNIAGEVASAVRGVIDIQNDISYREPEVEVTNDKEIKENIRQQLFWNPITNSQQIQIQVLNGNVLLTGYVATPLEKSVATVEAFQGGAAKVDNELEVTLGPRIVND